MPWEIAWPAEFLTALDTNWYEDDPLLHRLLARLAATDATPELHRWGSLCAGDLRELAEQSAPGEASVAMARIAPKLARAFGERALQR